jgi:hypothetical protein
MENKIKEDNKKSYHTVYIDAGGGILGARMRGESIKYIGKVNINVDEKTIDFDTLDILEDKEKECFYYVLRHRVEHGLRYVTSYDEKPKKKRKDDQVYEVLSRSPARYWSRMTAVPFNKDEFWDIFEKQGFSCNSQNKDNPHWYKIIDPKVGEIYYKNRWQEEQVKGELSNAVFLGRGDCIIYKGEKPCY